MNMFNMSLCVSVGEWGVGVGGGGGDVNLLVCIVCLLYFLGFSV